MIAKSLDLMRGGNQRYQKTAAYGHFGRVDPDFTWEVCSYLYFDILSSVIDLVKSACAVCGFLAHDDPTSPGKCL